MKTTKEKIDELESTLDAYDKKFLLHKVVVNLEVEKILELRQEHINSLSRDLLFTYSFILIEFGIAIQREHNRQSAKKKWAEHNLNIVIGKEGMQFGDKYTKYEVRRAMVIDGNEYAKALNDVIIQADCNIEEFNFLSSRINTLGETLREYAKSKRE